MEPLYLLPPVGMKHRADSLPAHQMLASPECSSPSIIMALLFIDKWLMPVMSEIGERQTAVHGTVPQNLSQHALFRLLLLSKACFAPEDTHHWEI